MIQNNEGIKFNNSNDDYDDEIDLGVFVRAVLRRKFLILSFSLFGLIYGLISWKTEKPTWQGEFQIVLSKPNQANPDTRTESIKASFLSNIGVSTENRLTTEVQILESPSVLMPTFEFIKKEKLKKGDESFEDMLFRDWKNKFQSKLEKNSSVLNIAYSDNDKSLIIPVLEKISKSYQDYSNKNRLRNIELALKYFEEQISIFKEKSEESKAKADDFGLKYSLTATLKSINGNFQGGFNLPNFVIEEELKRKNSRNAILSLENKLIEAKQLTNNPQKVLGMLSTLPGIKEGLGSELQLLEANLAMKRAIYNDNSPNIQIILEQRKNLVFSIKEQIIGFLNAQIDNQNAILVSTKRDDGVIQKYKELLNSSIKDAQILNNLENRLRLVKLEKARKEDPWELITNPTLLPEPVEPKLLKLALSRMLFGFISGTFFIFLYDKSRGKVFELNNLSKLFNCNSVINLSFKNNDEFKETIEIISLTKFSRIKDSLCILHFGDIPSNVLDEFKDNVGTQLPELKISITQEVKKIINFKNVIVLLSRENIRQNELIRYSQNLSFIENPLLAIMIIENFENIREI